MTEVAQDAAAAGRHYADDARNRAMKAEDRWHQIRLDLARRRRQNVTVLSMVGYGTQHWVRVFSRVVMAPDSHFVNGRRVTKLIADGFRGWRNFISAPVPFAEVTITAGGRTFDVVADRGGIVDAVIAVELEPGWRRVTLQADGAQPAAADVRIIADAARTGVVCDVDDTVVVTRLPRPLLAAWNSFVLDEHARTPTPGIAVMMERLMGRFPQAPVLYLSTGAWNVAQTLTRFLTRNLYPRGPLLLTDWGPTDERWFRSGAEHKVAELERLAVDFPEMSWLLIGDDGQHDPSIYADFARRHPQNVRAVIIRQLTYSEAMLAGGRASDPDAESLLGGVDERAESAGVADGSGDDAGRSGELAGVQRVGGRRIPWIYGPDGKDIVAKLERHGLLG